MLDSAPCQQAIRWFYDNTKAGLFAPARLGPGRVRPGQDRLPLRPPGRPARHRGQQRQGRLRVDLRHRPQGRRRPARRLPLHRHAADLDAARKSPDGSWELLKWLTSKQSGVNIALQPVGSLTPGYRKDVYCADELLNDARFPKSAMKANCDNFEQPDTYVYPANLRLVAPTGFQPILDKYMNDFMDLDAGADAGQHQADDHRDPAGARPAPPVAPSPSVPPDPPRPERRRSPSCTKGMIAETVTIAGPQRRPDRGLRRRAPRGASTSPAWW